MKALLYLIKKQFKNAILSLRYNPAKLIAYSLIVGFTLFIIGLSFFNKRAPSSKIRDLAELGSIIGAISLFIFWAGIYGGLEKGATFFKMPDVNFLFASPLSSKQILLYGMVKQMGQSLLISLFILYQIPNLISIYGISMQACLAIFIGYMMIIFIAQLCSMAVYMFSNGNQQRKKMVKIVLSGIVAVIGAFFLYLVVQGASFGEAFNQALALFDFVPFAGWIKGALYGILTNAWGQAAIYIVLTVIGVILLTVGILKSNADYYEDVLNATEHMEEAIQAAKKGKFYTGANRTAKDKKIKNYGLKKGKGASVLFYKQRLEDKRGGMGNYGINTMTVVQLFIALGISFFLGKNTEMHSLTILLIDMGALVYIQILSSGSQSWAQEISYHYIYLIPQSGLKKMLYISMGGLLKAFKEGVIIFVPTVILLGENLILIFLCIVIRVSFEMLFIALNILSQRLFGILGNKGMMLVLYLLAVFIVIIPGVVGAVILGSSIGSGSALIYAYGSGLLLMAGWNLLVSFVIGIFSNQIFEKMELNMRG
jgi:hypothetical protein